MTVGRGVRLPGKQIPCRQRCFIQLALVGYILGVSDLSCRIVKYPGDGPGQNSVPVHEKDSFKREDVRVEETEFRPAVAPAGYVHGEIGLDVINFNHYRAVVGELLAFLVPYFGGHQDYKGDGWVKTGSR
ncbi:uncharacterized protein N7446_012041 [Penicillium canescens]|uniref:Uncharacterized protein n=1 Tax=Penicillium canescens TaxID=5083 RepID=A0AAD6IB34_PENCN|nr:uncharacterized protein N7446_012041 [Penicillium canescens]KAJ6039018.1 hypothetical protein N7460_007050 [Penicillium canescens]KAJ6047207.1 hypothetical protein N7446_012041 [Penicillium canescens]KAJ6060091.1 hypothetical protein N7444_002837 [Penicillium canescens]